jgi:hypothetical protein
MMRALLLLLLALPAQANVCAPVGATGPSTVEIDATFEPLPCAPQWLGGTGRGDGWRAQLYGITAWTWCPKTDGTWTLRFGAATPGDVLRMSVDAPVLWGATDKLATLRQLYDKHVGRAIEDPELLPVWCPHWSAMLASRPADVPIERWVVAKAPSNANPPGTRPTYYYAAGTFTNSQQRVKELTPCNPAVARIKVDYVTWCAIDGSTVLYAVASKLP